MYTEINNSSVLAKQRQTERKEPVRKFKEDKSVDTPIDEGSDRLIIDSYVMLQ